MSDFTTELELSAPRAALAVSAALAEVDIETPEQILRRARTRVPSGRALYAGALTPQEAWSLIRAGGATLVDVRTPEERQLVGYVPQSEHVPWAFGSALQRNPRFVEELESHFGREQVVLFLCRSGSRSAAAAQAATHAGYRDAFSVLEGFEGALDPLQPGAPRGGWKSRGLPWVHD